jgi:hypothetical protein
MDDHHFGYITASLKQTLVPQISQMFPKLFPISSTALYLIWFARQSSVSRAQEEWSGGFQQIACASLSSVCVRFVC